MGAWKEHWEHGRRFSAFGPSFPSRLGGLWAGLLPLLRPAWLENGGQRTQGWAPDAACSRRHLGLVLTRARGWEDSEVLEGLVRLGYNRLAWL